MDTSLTILDTSLGSEAILIGNSSGSIYKTIMNQQVNDKLRNQILPNAVEEADFNAMARNTKPGAFRVKQPNIKDSIGNFIYWNNSNDSVLVRQYAGDKYLLALEKSPKINWQITDETKLQKGHSCKKATGHFRGRDYTVWFATDIPILEGPCKFKGLPGLVMDLVDNKNQVRIFVEKIEYPCLDTIPKISTYNMPGKWTTIESLITYQNEKAQKLLEKMEALSESYLDDAKIKHKDMTVKTGYFGIEKKLD